MLMKRFPKLEIVKGSLSEKDEAVQQAINRSDFFLRDPGMGQSTDFMIHCRKIGKPTPFSPPSGLTQRLFQEPPAKTKFLAVRQI